MLMNSVAAVLAEFFSLFLLNDFDLNVLWLIDGSLQGEPHSPDWQSIVGDNQNSRSPPSSRTQSKPCMQSSAKSML